MNNLSNRKLSSGKSPTHGSYKTPLYNINLDDNDEADYAIRTKQPSAYSGNHSLSKSGQRESSAGSIPLSVSTSRQRRVKIMNNSTMSKKIIPRTNPASNEHSRL